MRVWYIALLPRKIASTLFTNLLPLYVAYTLGRDSVDVGVVAASVWLAYIPGSFIWGYLADRTRRCRFITVSSIIVYSILLILFTRVGGLLDLVALCLLIGFFGSAIPPVEDILIAEGSSRDEWCDESRSYGIVSEIGDLLGLAMGALVLSFYEHVQVVYLCGFLALSSALASLIFVEDPMIMVERKMVRLERCIGSVEKLSMILVSQDLYGERIARLAYPRIGVDPSRSILFFGIGALTFTMATDAIFTFIAIYLCRVLGIPQSIAFTILLLNEIGSIAGYILFKDVYEYYGSYRSLRLSAFIRAILILTLIPCGYLPYIAAVIVDTIILMVVGIFYTLFALSSRVVRMEMIPEGWMGLYACLTRIGSIAGMAIGGYIVTQYGFDHLFTIAGILFLSSCILFHLA
ncbi:MFS transporter [Candidatus Bathyarchaeota archaeon]|nr:MFS transporter [Candidatus Bathyarchaeota archaeon]